MKKTTRIEAQHNGKKRYFTGKPCKRGHIAERQVANWGCVECLRENQRNKLRDDKEYAEKRRGAYRNWWNNNKEAARNSAKRWRNNNLDATRARAQDWKKKNPNRNKEHSMKRHAALKKAMPHWVDRKSIQNIYDECPVGMHVDHIVPLQGDNVSGLHVPWNLQYLSPFENVSKGNKLL